MRKSDAAPRTQNQRRHHVVLEQLGEATTIGCKRNAHATLGVTFPTTFKDGTIGVGEGAQLTIDTWGTATTSATFSSDSYSGAHEPSKLVAACHLTGSMHFQASDSGGDLLEVGPSVLKRTAGEEATCPSKDATVEGTFTLETSNGTPVTIDFVSTE